MRHHVGKAVSHESANAHVSGSAKYVDDLWPSMASMVHTCPVLSPHARANVLAIDASLALKAPGVLGCFTAADVKGENDIGPARHDDPLFPTEVRFHGQAVAWIAAESEAEAIAGAALVQVEYEPLPAVLGFGAALHANSFLTELDCIRRGDPEAALRRSSKRLSGELLIGGQEHFYLETQAALAWVDESGGIMVQSSTQHPSETQEVVARVLGVPRNEVVVQCLRMGGGFGGKEVQASAWACIAAVMAVKLKRPVRVRLTRHQDMTMTGKRHPFLARFEVGFDAQGKLSALKAQLFSDGGYCLDLSAPILTRALFHIDNCYFLPNVEVTGRVCMTHTVSHTAFRGFGGPQGMLVIEEIMDRVARSCLLPPHVVRERNFYKAGDTAHYGQVIEDASRIELIWEQLKASSDFEARWLEIEEFNDKSRFEKRGLAITPVKFGISFTTSMFNQAGALVLIYKDGSVQLNHGGTEMGQGLHTKMRQVAAEALGVELNSIRSMPTRTDKVPNTSATAASSGSDLNGAAVRNACETLKNSLVQVAARHFQAHPEDIAIEDGKVFAVSNLQHSITFAELVEHAYSQRVPLFASGYYRTPHLHYDAKAGRGKPFHYYAYGAAVCEVSVSAFTGQYRILAADILHDVGDSLSPLIDRGQVEGGFIQGLGWLTTEELVWKTDGTFASSGASTYKLPSLGECPERFNVELLAKATQPGVIYGSKAVGEPPLMLAISVREALRAAVAAFAEPGNLVELGIPATPEAVFWAIDQFLPIQDDVELSRAAQ